MNESYNRGGNNDWDTSTTAPTPSHSKLRGAAGTATKVLAKTAAVALPTVGLIFLTRALNRNSGYGGMGNSMGSGMGMGNGMGGYPYQGSGYMPGYGQQPYGNYNGW